MQLNLTYPYETAPEQLPRKCLSNQLQELRKQLGDLSKTQQQRIITILKLIHIKIVEPSMLINFGIIDCMKLACSQSSLWAKFVGYLALTLLVQGQQQLIILLTSRMKRDLMHQNHIIVAMILKFIPSVCNESIIDNIYQDIAACMGRGNFIAKRAIIVAIRLVQRTPHLVQYFMPFVWKCMGNGDEGVINSGIWFVSQVLSMQIKQKQLMMILSNMQLIFRHSLTTKTPEQKTQLIKMVISIHQMGKYQDFCKYIINCTIQMLVDNLKIQPVISGSSENQQKHKQKQKYRHRHRYRYNQNRIFCVSLLRYIAVAGCTAEMLDVIVDVLTDGYVDCNVVAIYLNAMIDIGAMYPQILTNQLPNITKYAQIHTMNIFQISQQPPSPYHQYQYYHQHYHHQHQQQQLVRLCDVLYKMTNESNARQVVEVVIGIIGNMHNDIIFSDNNIKHVVQDIIFRALLVAHRFRHNTTILQYIQLNLNQQLWQYAANMCDQQFKCLQSPTECTKTAKMQQQKQIKYSYDIAFAIVIQNIIQSFQKCQINNDFNDQMCSQQMSNGVNSIYLWYEQLNQQNRAVAVRVLQLMSYSKQQQIRKRSFQYLGFLSIKQSEFQLDNLKKISKIIPPRQQLPPTILPIGAFKQHQYSITAQQVTTKIAKLQQKMLIIKTMHQNWQHQKQSKFNRQLNQISQAKTTTTNKNKQKETQTQTQTQQYIRQIETIAMQPIYTYQDEFIVVIIDKANRQIIKILNQYALTMTILVYQKRKQFMRGQYVDFGANRDGHGAKDAKVSFAVIREMKIQVYMGSLQFNSKHGCICSYNLKITKSSPQKQTKLKLKLQYSVNGQNHIKYHKIQKLPFDFNYSSI